MHIISIETHFNEIPVFNIKYIGMQQVRAFFKQVITWAVRPCVLLSTDICTIYIRILTSSCLSRIAAIPFGVLKLTRISTQMIQILSMYLQA